MYICNVNNINHNQKKKVMKQETKVTAIEHADVRGKKLLYLKVEKNGKEVLINVGEKTYNAVKELDNEKTESI